MTDTELYIQRLLATNPIRSFCEENAHLWFDAFGELAGFAISESGEAGFHILTLNGYRFLYEEILQWALENWKGRVGKGSNFSTEVIEHQCWESEILERYGFRSTHTFCCGGSI